ncbi:MAG: transposase [Rhodobacter sp.]|nr:transposase [Rhodobacter sp.]
MPGARPISALAVETFAPPMEQFTRGRDFAAWLGLAPRQAPIGGTQKRGKTRHLAQGRSADEYHRQTCRDRACGRGAAKPGRRPASSTAGA